MASDNPFTTTPIVIGESINLVDKDVSKSIKGSDKKNIVSIFSFKFSLDINNPLQIV